MDGWGFHTYRAALEGLSPQRAGLVGLAAAERIGGCLRDPRFHRFDDLPPQLVDDLLDRCWSVLLMPCDGVAQEIRELADRVSSYNIEYNEQSMTELFHSYGPFDEPDEEAPDLEEFIEEAEPEGAILLHLEALIALTEIALACVGGPWDGALRCLQAVAMAAVDLPAPTGGEPGRQQRDLNLARSHDPSADMRDLATVLRARARIEAVDWQESTEQKDLYQN